MMEGQHRLADGTVVDVNSGRVVRNTTHIEIPTVHTAQSLVAATRRKLAELPSIPERMHPIAVVLSYKLFGLVDDEIALALNWPVEQVARIQQMREYADMHEAVVNSIMQGETANVRDLFTKYSRNAAVKMIDMMNSEDEGVAIAATKDVLDRAGHRPADMIVEQRSKMQADLVIKYVKEDRSADMPVIDIKPEEAQHGV